MSRAFVARLAALGIGAALLASGCARGPGDQPSLGPSGAAPNASGARHATISSDDGLVTLDVDLASTDVVGGEAIAVTGVLTNRRSTAVTYANQACGAPIAVTLSASVPVAPAGRTWAGVSDAFKARALASALAPGGLPATDPIPLPLLPIPCTDAADFELTLAPGASVSTTISGASEYATGIPLQGGDATLRIEAGYDRLNGPPSYPPDYTGIRGSWVPAYRPLRLDQPLTIRPPERRVLSIGEAIDAALADTRFARWLNAEPVEACETINLYLANQPAGAGPAWQLEVFCTTGVPRQFRILSIDPFTGVVRAVNACDDPYDR